MNDWKQKKLKQGEETIKLGHAFFDKLMQFHGTQDDGKLLREALETDERFKDIDVRMNELVKKLFH